MALKRGDKISSYEGVDFGGNKYAIVLDFAPAEEGKAFLSLYFPESKSARKYKVAAGSNAAVMPTSGDEKAEPEDGSSIPTSEVDNLRAKSPGMDSKPNRNFQPDSYFPEDPNYPSTMTDVLWRPELRWTPFPRFYHTKRRRAMLARRRRTAVGTLETVGTYFRQKFGVLLAGFDDGDLDEVPLDSHVGEQCKRFMDRSSFIVNDFKQELPPGEARMYSKSLIEGTVAMMQVWYYG